MNFSVVLIARNEAKTLPRLLDSLATFQKRGGEVVLVDTGSTDGTSEVARARGCAVTEVGDRFVHKLDNADLVAQINGRFIHHNDRPIVELGDKLFDFGSARNFAATLASCDMVAMPDCDEVYTTLNLDVIQKHVTEGVGQFHYNFVFSHSADGGRELQFRHSKFYNRTKMKWHGIVHEILKPVGDAHVDAHVGEDVILLEHWQNHETNRAQYLKGLALACFQEPLNDRNTHYLAREFYYTKRYHSAIELFKRHIEMPSWQPERARSMCFIGDCHDFLGDEKNALVWWHKSFDEFPSREPLIRLVDYHFKKKDHIRVAAYAAAANAVPKPDAYFVQREHYGTRPTYLQFWAHWWMGEKDRARRYLDECITAEPNNERYTKDKELFYS